METAGKFIDNEELRDAMKENGIGRPSTRAAIIETLFKREYIRKERKNLIATNTGVDLIQTISEELLKSAELTGRWEKKLRQIEKGEYKASVFLDELKEMLRQIVFHVKSENRINQQQVIVANKIIQAGLACPKCGKGIILKGNSAYGCSRWKEGCEFRMPFGN
jgi:DNA topoisomerase-3